MGNVFLSTAIIEWVKYEKRKKGVARVTENVYNDEFGIGLKVKRDHGQQEALFNKRGKSFETFFVPEIANTIYQSQKNCIRMDILLISQYFIRIMF